MPMCTECGATVVKTTILPEYEIDLGGLRVKLVNAVIREVCEACGDATIEIPDIGGLARVAAMARALLPLRLNGEEIRFIRKALDMNGREFAQAMELTPETVSRWENGVPGVGGYVEKLLRHNVCALLHSKTPAIVYDPVSITHMRIINTPEGFVLPTLEFRRVLVKDKRDTEETWGQLPIAA